jgi:hypothetical protein
VKSQFRICINVMRMRNDAAELILELWRFKLEPRMLTLELLRLTLGRGGVQASAAYLHHSEEDPDPQKTQIRINMNNHTGFYMNSCKFLPKNRPTPKKNNLGRSVADPDPYVFVPPGSGSCSISQRIRLRILSLSKTSKKNIDSLLFCTFFMTLS